MKNILLENVDVIYGIARQNNVDIGVGADMFTTNLNVAGEQYKGAAGRRTVDYKAISPIWHEMGAEAQRAARNAYNEQAKRHYNKLVELSKEEKCREMLELVLPIPTDGE